MVDLERAHAGDDVLSGPGDQGKSGSQAAVDAVIARAANSLRTLSHKNFEVVTEKRTRVGGVQLSGGGDGELGAHGALIPIIIERPIEPVLQAGRAADLLREREVTVRATRGPEIQQLGIHVAEADIDNGRLVTVDLADMNDWSGGLRCAAPGGIHG